MLRATAVFCAVLAGGWPSLAAAGLIQTQRAQRGIDIIVTVTAPIVNRGTTKQTVPGWNLAMLSPSLLARLAPLASMIAANQGAVNVQATVVADPTANLLVLNKTTYSATQTSGTTMKYTCAFTVAVNTTIIRWTIDDALGTDFSPQFTGGNVAWSIYPSSQAPPSPETFTPYVVYPTNNNSFQVTTTSGGNASYCVDLQLTVPAGLKPGTYSTTAVYSLYY